MTVVSDPTEVARITALVQQALDKRQPKTFRVKVRPDGVMSDRDWYHVVVTSDQDVRTYDFYDVLAEAEAEIQDEAGHHVVLVPTLAD